MVTRSVIIDSKMKMMWEIAIKAKAKAYRRMPPPHSATVHLDLIHIDVKGALTGAPDLAGHAV